MAAAETIVGMAGAFHGISRRPSGKWVAYVKKDGVRQCLSGFEHEDEAALAHDRLALHLFGELAILNFPLRKVEPADAATIRRETTQRRKSKQSSTYLGVCWMKSEQRWQASLFVDGKERHIGTFEDEREAAEAYDRVVKMMRGGDAPLNFPGDARLTPITPEALKAERRDERKGSASSRHRGVTWVARDGRWGARIVTGGVQHSLGLYEDEEVAALAYDRAARHFHGRRAALNFPTRRSGSADPATLQREASEATKATTASRYRGVVWAVDRQRWRAQIASKGEQFVLGTFDDEAAAARCYDRAAKALHGQEAELNFPKHPRLPPANVEELRAEARAARKALTSSRHRGVRWDAPNGKWSAVISAGGQTYSLGQYDEEDDAARAYDRAARHFHGDRAQLNLPQQQAGPAGIMELRRLARASFKETTTSRYRGVSWAEDRGQWLVQITTEGDKRTLGYFDDEYAAAQAYDRTAAMLHGDKAMLNFPALTARSRPTTFAAVETVFPTPAPLTPGFPATRQRPPRPRVPR